MTSSVQCVCACTDLCSKLYDINNVLILVVKNCRLHARSRRHAKRMHFTHAIVTLLSLDVPAVTQLLHQDLQGSFNNLIFAVLGQLHLIGVVGCTYASGSGLTASVGATFSCLFLDTMRSFVGKRITCKFSVAFIHCLNFLVVWGFSMLFDHIALSLGTLVTNLCMFALELAGKAPQAQALL